jgi:hypothetical protein
MQYFDPNGDVHIQHDFLGYFLLHPHRSELDEIRQALSGKNGTNIDISLIFPLSILTFSLLLT